MTTRLETVLLSGTALGLAVILITPAARAQSAGPPEYAVGDSWVRKIGSEKREVKVTKVEDTGTWFVGGRRDCGTCLTFFDKNLTMLRLTDASGKDVDVTQMGFVPMGSDWKLYDFPLEVNKKWTFSATGFFRGTPAKWEADNAVEAYEDVKTAAGTFKAFKLRRNMVYSAQGAGGAFRVNWTDVLWFAPDVKSVVKYTSTGRNAEEWELASYNVK